MAERVAVDPLDRWAESEARVLARAFAAAKRPLAEASAYIEQQLQKNAVLGKRRTIVEAAFHAMLVEVAR